MYSTSLTKVAIPWQNPPGFSMALMVVTTFTICTLGVSRASGYSQSQAVNSPSSSQSYRPGPRFLINPNSMGVLPGIKVGWTKPTCSLLVAFVAAGTSKNASKGVGTRDPTVTNNQCLPAQMSTTIVQWSNVRRRWPAKPNLAPKVRGTRIRLTQVARRGMSTCRFSPPRFHFAIGNLAKGVIGC